jgi:hypothetical protein
MDFGLSPAEQAFAEEVRAFLRAHPQYRTPRRFKFGGCLGPAYSKWYLSAYHSLSPPCITMIRRNPMWYAATAASRLWAQVVPPQ